MERRSASRRNGRNNRLLSAAWHERVPLSGPTGCHLTMMRPSAWADRLMALSVRFVGLVIMLAALVAAVASFFYNKAQEVDQAARVAMQVDTRLLDQDRQSVGKGQSVSERTDLGDRRTLQ